MTQATLILLHGATMNAHAWDAVRRHIDPKYRVIAPDLPGHGARRSEEFTLCGAVEAVRGCVASVAGAPLVLVGDSLGGYTAQAAAPLTPKDQLKGLVLGGSTAVLEGPAYLPYLATVGMFRLMMACFGEPKLNDILLPKSLRQQGLAERDVQSMTDAGLNVRSFGPAIAAIREFGALRNLAAISAPMLFVNGDRDGGMIRGEPKFLRLAQQARAHRFENCGHGVSMRRPAEFAALVNQFAATVFE